MYCFVAANTDRVTKLNCVKNRPSKIEDRARCTALQGTGMCRIYRIYMYATRTYIIGTPRIVRLSVERFPGFSESCGTVAKGRKSRESCGVGGASDQRPPQDLLTVPGGVRSYLRSRTARLQVLTYLVRLHLHLQPQNLGSRSRVQISAPHEPERTRIRNRMWCEDDSKIEIVCVV